MLPTVVSVMRWFKQESGEHATTATSIMSSFEKAVNILQSPQAL